MGKTRDRFKKIRDTKGTFYAKMGAIKDGNSKDLTEAGELKGKGRGINQEYGINRYTPLYIKQINNKDLLYSTENYIQQFVITYNRK